MKDESKKAVALGRLAKLFAMAVPFARAPITSGFLDTISVIVRSV
jgi:hypothetical protein